MNSPFARPEKPVKMSQMEIIDLIKKGAACFCGKCGKQIVIVVDVFYKCSCSFTVKTDENTVFSLRVESVSDKILLDFYPVPPGSFNPLEHFPAETNNSRLQRSIRRSKEHDNENLS